LNADTIKTIKQGCETRNRALTNLPTATEVGIKVPLLLDHKFLSAYKLMTVASPGSPKSASSIVVNEIIGNEITKKRIFDFENKRILNGYFGVSSKTGFKETYDIRPTYNNLSNSLDTSLDVDDISNPILIGLATGDNIIAARQPQDMVETSFIPTTRYLNSDLVNQTSSFFTIRNPRLINVHDHANTMFGNFDAGEERYLVIETTGEGTINPLLLYRFSFYYRINGEMKITPVIQYFTNTGSFLKIRFRDERSYNVTATESTDLSFFDLLIPDVAKGEIIPDNTNRIRISLKFEAVTDCKIELAYPILEHSYNTSPAVAVVIPEHPSSIKPKDVHSGELTQGWTGKNITFDNSRLFFGHPGRKLFDVALGYSLKDSNIVSELRMLENFNERGDIIVLRVKHHDLPPVLCGDIKITNSNPTFDYHYNDMAINFTETD